MYASSYLAFGLCPGWGVLCLGCPGARPPLCSLRAVVHSSKFSSCVKEHAGAERNFWKPLSSWRGTYAGFDLRGSMSLQNSWLLRAHCRACASPTFWAWHAVHCPQHSLRGCLLLCGTQFLCHLLLRALVLSSQLWEDGDCPPSCLTCRVPLGYKDKRLQFPDPCPELGIQPVLTCSLNGSVWL